MDFMVVRPRLRHQGEAIGDCLGGRSKRLFDIVVGSILLTLTLPILLVAAAALKCTGSGPVFAREPRLGFKGRLFTAIEFGATTREGRRSESVAKSRNKLHRRTDFARIGEFLHDSGIHKLPQLVNVLRGEMSLVGPRPLPLSEVRLQGDRIAAYLEARPGLGQAPRTAKLGGRCPSEPSDPDLDYVRNWRLSMDLTALVLTIFTWKGP
jgi:lipopolysaccharide/colanic/teichoic acid biosynthesis glycosyltransferase